MISINAVLHCTSPTACLLIIAYSHGSGFLTSPVYTQSFYLNLFLLNPLDNEVGLVFPSPVSSPVSTQRPYTGQISWLIMLYLAKGGERWESRGSNPGLAVLTPYWFSTHSRDPGLHKIKVWIPLCRLVKDHSAAGVRDLVMEVTKLMFCLLLLPITFHTVWQLSLPYQKNVFKWFNVMNQHLYMYI